MIPVLLAQIGLPLLLKFVGGALAGIDNPTAKGAAEAVREVQAALDRKDITPAQLAEANRHLERLTELDSTVLAEINATFRTELGVNDPYVRRWRPTFGYAMALTWTVTMTAIAWAIIADPAQAPSIITALVNTSPIWGIALGVLGISVVKRSQDKTLLK
ncbi:3TM-type holin [Telmatospirillum sp. J64-1]|uniref:3TM-type holin n=1 Tax=Telmatospirillum sp. J64-1 TaxID=2502183 RepID=UPI00115C58F5|nr:3TM-type holin [Telmatospirillum sp. J64-1]